MEVAPRKSSSVGPCRSSRTSAWLRRFARALARGGGIRHARLAEPLELAAEPVLPGIVGGREPGVHVLHEIRDAPRERVVSGRAGLLEHVGGREGQIAHGVSHHRVAGLEALDALLLRVDGAAVDVDVAREPIRDVGDLPGGVAQAVLEPRHARDVGGEGIEVREGVGLHARDLDAPVGGELLDLANEADRAPIVRRAAAARDEVERPGGGEQEDRDDGAENGRAGFHGDSSSDSPASVRMNATIASLSSSGASRPS